MSNRVKSWSIHERPEITARYEILRRVGSGAYADVYRGRRLSDDLPVALKEIHDRQSALREIESLRVLNGSLNVISMIEYFYEDDFEEDAVIVLEFLDSDLEAVIKRGGPITAGEAKRWMLQVLTGVDACHRAGIMHRDLKPSNLLISSQGILKIADFGQSRIFQDPNFEPENLNPYQASNESNELNLNKQTSESEYLKEFEILKNNINSKYEDNGSCLATCSTGDTESEKLSIYTFETEEIRVSEANPNLTSCVGTRWYKSPELLYGSTRYGPEIDLWSLGCIFAELFNSKPLFPGVSDIDQIAKIITVLGVINDDNYPNCSNLPDFSKITFSEIESPIGLETCLLNRSIGEINIVKKLIIYDPLKRINASELLNDGFFNEEPLPIRVEELIVPVKEELQESSDEEWNDCRDVESYEGINQFGSNVSVNERGFSIKFS